MDHGLSIREGKAQFSESKSDDGKILTHGSHTILTTKLSVYINKRVDFIKLNIEGSELEVLQDLDQSHSFQYIQEICMEWHSFSNQDQNLDEILNIFKKNNFKYLINHFDYITNYSVKPPFNLEKKSQYYLLVYAKKIDIMENE